MNPEALPIGLQRLIITNAALDIPTKAMRRGGIVGLFGFGLFLLILLVVVISWFVILLYNIIALIVILFCNIIALIEMLYRWLFSLTSTTAPADNASVEPLIVPSDQETPTSFLTPPLNLDSPLEYIGSITWIYMEKKPDDKALVRRAIQDKESLTIFCNTGTDAEPYEFEIRLRTLDGKYFQGDFAGGHPPNDTFGTADGTLQRVTNGFIFSGDWKEQDLECRWFLALKQVESVPDVAYKPGSMKSIAFVAFLLFTFLIFLFAAATKAPATASQRTATATPVIDPGETEHARLSQLVSRIGRAIFIL